MWQYAVSCHWIRSTVVYLCETERRKILQPESGLRSNLRSNPIWGHFPVQHVPNPCRCCVLPYALLWPHHFQDTSVLCICIICLFGWLLKPCWSTSDHKITLKMTIKCMCVHQQSVNHILKKKQAWMLCKITYSTRCVLANPGLISYMYTGAVRRWGMLFHAQNSVRWLTLSM